MATETASLNAGKLDIFQNEVRFVTDEWNHALPDELICLLDEMTQFLAENELTCQEKKELAGMESKLADQLARELKKSADWALKTLSGDRVGQLIRLKKYLTDKRIPNWLKRRLQAEFGRVFDALNANSLKMARYFVERTETLLAEAGANVNNTDFSALQRLDIMFGQTRELENLIAKMPLHVKHAFSTVATEMGVTVDALLDSFKARALAINSFVPALQKRAAYELLHADEIAREKRAEAARQYQEEQTRAILAAQKRDEKALKVRREKEIAALIVRCPKAKQFAERFYLNLEQGNLDAAWDARNQIRRLDNGVPPIMNEDYQKAAAKLPQRPV